MALLARFLYPPLYSLLLLIYAPFLMYRVLCRRKGSLSPLADRLGRLPPGLSASPAESGPRIWLHAVSVGEVISVRPLVRRLCARPGRLFISTTTETGQQVAKDLYGEQATVFFFPVDWRWLCRRYLRAVAPQLVLLTETELWPSFIGGVEDLGIPLVLINGRISDRSLGSYRRLRFFFRPLLHTFCKLAMQSSQDKQRILQIGAPPERTHSIGNLKFDYSLTSNPEAERLVERLGSVLGKEEDSLIWVAGSTREGEEELLAPVFLALRHRFKGLRWIVAPRHCERAGEVATILARHQISFQLRSQIENCDPGDPPEAVLIDSVGELAHVFQAADVVFIGGSLVPWGGHNVIEAAHFSKPILFGPHMHNFREISDTFLEAYAALQVGSPQELEEKLRALLLDPDSRAWLGRNARSVIRKNQGAVERTLDLIDQCAPRSVNSDTTAPEPS